MYFIESGIRKHTVVDEEEVEVLEAPISQLLLANLLDMLLCMKGVPKLRRNEYILPLNNTLVYCPL